MITNRPDYLTADPNYAVIPAAPFGLDLATVPEWIKFSLLHLGGVQPITRQMAEAAKFILEDRPSEAELELYRRNGTRFQTVSVIASIAAFRKSGDTIVGVPYAISLMPASKGGAVSQTNADFVGRIDLNHALQSQEPCYVEFNPFAGQWGLWGPISSILYEPRREFPDTLGVVTDMYFLQLGFEPDDVLEHMRTISTNARRSIGTELSVGNYEARVIVLIGGPIA